MTMLTNKQAYNTTFIVNQPFTYRDSSFETQPSSSTHIFYNTHTHKISYELVRWNIYIVGGSSSDIKESIHRTQRLGV